MEEDGSLGPQNSLQIDVPGSCGAADLYGEHTTAAVAAARTHLTFSTKNSARLSTLMSFEAFIT